MCGIVGYMGKQEAVSNLIRGLKTLEYRGYDSAGVSVLNGAGLQVRRSVGKLDALEKLLVDRPVHGTIGLGHTRWATHGEPSVTNAHPHTDASGQVAVVHNGIIENYASLKQKLQDKGIAFRSQTDTEVVAQLIGFYWKKMASKNFHDGIQDVFIKSVLAALEEIKGTYALGIMCSLFPNLMIGTRRECPLIIGLTKDSALIASDVPALLPHTRDVIILEDGDLALFNNGDLQILNSKEQEVKRPKTHVVWDPVQAEKGDYPHFMIKEIHEQPRIVTDTLRGRWNDAGPNLEQTVIGAKEAKQLSELHLVACGTSWHAGLVGSYWMEKWTHLPCHVTTASEFRYRDIPLSENSLVIAISQSGETADTLAAVRLAKSKGAKIFSIANVIGSTLTRESHASLLTHCGPEIGVASTKAFMGQLVVLYLLALQLAQLRKSLPETEIRSLTRDIVDLPSTIAKTLKCEEQIKAIASTYADRNDFLYLGRHLNYPVALEGALKLKEISYIHAEGYPAGEMKHGPIALIGEGTPVLAIATASSVYEKILSNVEEVRSRRAAVIAIATEGETHVDKKAADTVFVPAVPEVLSPMVNVVPLQMLAYYIAVMRGCDVDKPRNLAKSVTVE